MSAQVFPRSKRDPVNLISIQMVEAKERNNDKIMLFKMSELKIDSALFIDRSCEKHGKTSFFFSMFTYVRMSFEINN